ncbi:MAG: DNA polymerase I [Clostridia bacterium]|nr:DNA polymerase I [Clostridia bacterium]
MKKILVIDGNSIINRAFFGVRPLTTKSGKNTNAVFGMINIISRQMDALKPDYAAVCFDLKHPTFRHEMFSEYKAGRNPTPPELLEQLPEAKECLRLMGLHVLELPGYEADDIQGTVAKLAHECEEETESYILSGDRDLLQLIDDKITVLLATNTETKAMREPEFKEKYGILPTQFVDMKALMGDSSDNIPGVRGIGEKTAASLIQNFGTLEGIYENIDDSRITKSVRAKLTEGKDNAYLSRKLARIETHVPIEKTLNDLKYEGINKGGLYKKFTELELNSFITKFKLSAADLADGANEMPEKAAETQEKSEVSSEIPPTRAKKISENYQNLLDGAKRISVVNLDGGFGICDGEYSYVVDFQNPILKELFEKELSVICYDGKALLHKLNSLGVKASHGVALIDLMLYAYVLNPGSGDATLPSLISMFLSETAIDGEDFSDLLFPLEKVMRDKVCEAGGEKVLDELELPLIRILFEMETEGFKINTYGMLEFADALDELAHELQERIYVQALGEFNINSPKQLGEVLYVKLGLPCKSKKNKNGFSTDAETLEELRQYSPIIDDILEYRQVTKLRGTYAAALPKLADENARIHTDFKQALTATGRLSSADPNLQNIPIRTKMGREMRRYFISREGYSLVDADYSQIELRLLAHISDDYNMSEAFREGVDIHRKTASAVFGIPEESVNDEMRKRAKAVNFGIVYGISGFSLAKDIGITTSEASKYIKSYLLNYPFIDSYLERVVVQAKENGYTETLMGRRRYIPELNAANGMLRAFGKRVAMNAPIQGTAADIMKLAMIKVYERLRREEPEAKLVMQVHDELIVEAPDERIDSVKKILAEEMENAVKLNVPLTVDVTSGKNWLDQE